MFRLILIKRLKGQTGAGGTNEVEKMVALKYLSNFWRTVEITINCEANIILTCSANCVISTAANQATRFPIIDTKFYVLVVTLSTQYNATLLEQFKAGSKRTINWNNYQSKVTIEGQNHIYIN